MKLKLIKKTVEARGTKTFFWEPEKAVKYLPGQYYYFTLPKLNYPDPRGSTRHFTLSSSPTEPSVIRNTTRIRQESGFKKTLDELPIGTLIDGEGPNGTFILDELEVKGPHIFLAGGIGITPFRSMIKYIVDKGLGHEIYLIYSDSTRDDMPFKKELEELSKSHSNIKIEFIFTKAQGRIDLSKIKELVKKYKLRVKDCTWWVVGPPAFVDAIEQILGKLKVSLGKARTEKFTGY